MILYKYDSNSILVEVTTGCTDKNLLQAYRIPYNRVIKANVTTKVQCMDNETSDIFKSFLVKQGINLQHTLGHIHQCNTADISILRRKPFHSGIGIVESAIFPAVQESLFPTVWNKCELITLTPTEPSPFCL